MFSLKSVSGLRNAATEVILPVLSARSLSSVSKLPKACVVGAAGGIGQPLSLLLKASPFIGDLSLYDIVGTPGVAADLSHICTAGKVKGFVGDAELKAALDGCQAVVIPAGVPRKPGMTRDDLFNTNAGIVRGIAKACAEVCPNASFFIISNPVNSTVPIFAETFKKVNPSKYTPKRIYGVTTLDVTRANTFCAEAMNVDAKSLNVTVIGGHAGTTILPLLSQIPGQKFTQEQLDSLTNRIQFGGDEVVKAKNGTGSATLSMAYAANVFVEKVMRAYTGDLSEVIECTFVHNEIYKAKHGCEFFASPVKIDKDGIKTIIETKLSPYEQKIFDSMIGDLKSQIQKGKEYVAAAN